MKKLLLVVLVLWSAVASAQFTPGQVLTAAELNSQFALYAPLIGAAFTGPVALPAGSSLSGYLTTAAASGTYAPLVSPTFTGTVTIPTGAAISGYAQLASPTFTGSPIVPGYLTTAAASSTYAPLASPTFTGTPTVPGYLTTATASTTYAPITSPTFTGTVTAASLITTGNLTPSQTAGIVGTTTNNNANAGSVGEYLSNTGTAIALTSASPTTVAAITLTAGDWDVWGAAQYLPAGTTVIANQVIGINTTNSLPSSITQEGNTTGTKAAGQGDIINISPFRVTLTGSQVYNLVVQGSFSVSTCTSTGTIQARRRR